jgi:hypothetical protein
MLLIQYVGENPEEQKAVLQKKDKVSCPFNLPFLLLSFSLTMPLREKA